MNMVVMMLPGVSVTYQGDELGMVDGEVSWTETVDPMGCNTNSTVYDDYSRDPARTPFHWDNTYNAGFSNAARTWLPVASTYPTINVDVELNANGNSHLKIYKDLINLRNRRVMRLGSYRYRENNNVFILKRFISGEEIVVLLGNMNDHNIYMNLNEVDPSIPVNLEILIVSMNSEKVVGTTLNTNSFLLKPSEAIVCGGTMGRQVFYWR